VIADDWKVMQADLIKTEESIKYDLSNYGSNTLKVVNDNVSQLWNQADKSLALLLETKASFEVGTLLNR
jgi:hypothetical protein